MADDPSQGLWVGEVLINKVSLVDAKDHLQPTSDTARLRLILHVDAQGQVSLLQKAILVSGAGTDLKLFTDEFAIAKFVVDAKHTERVVKHLESASFDLPRTKLPPFPLPTNFDPTELAQEYEQAHELVGQLIPAATVKTREGQFVIDRWHRTNPYRHAFHPNHTVGFRIVRELQLKFDELDLGDSKEVPSVLTGTYEESIFGLLKPKVPVRMAGTFSLQRIATTAQIEKSLSN